MGSLSRAEKIPDPPSRQRTWRRRMLFGASVLALGLLVRCCVADLGRVAGGSMWPTLRNGDYILTNKLAYGLRLPGTHFWLGRWSEPRAGDVVVLSSPLDGRRVVKRIAAGPGDALTNGGAAGATVPPGQFFVTGDGANSVDSRAFGCVPRERIMGRVAGVFSFGP